MRKNKMALVIISVALETPKGVFLNFPSQGKARCCVFPPGAHTEAVWKADPQSNRAPRAELC